MLIGIIGWVIVGLITGFVASRVANLRGDDPGLGIAIGGAGAVAGGWLYTAISGSGVGYFNLFSLFFAAIGAIAAVAIWHLMRRRSAHRDAIKKPW